MKGHFLIVKSCNNPDISNTLASNSILEIEKAGYTYEIITVTNYYQIPTAVKMAVELDVYDGLIALGSLISNNDLDRQLYVESIKLINQISVDYAIPISCGFIYAKNNDEALEELYKANMAVRSSVELFELSEFFISKLENYDQSLIDIQ